MNKIPLKSFVEFALRHRFAIGIGAAVLLLVLIGAWITGGKTPKGAYRTEPATRGNLVVTVSATGNVQPTNQVDVGSELSGSIAAVLVDENDKVKKGQILARLDTSKLENQVQRAKAALQSAEANVQQAAATTLQARAELARLRKVQELSGGKVPSATDLETAEATLARGEAAEAVARASVADAHAALDSATTDLTKASIRSPINGVVLARKVEPGQTVAASLQAPVLFTLAEDLAQLQLQADVDEADVGKVKEGQEATFTVDAWPNREYPARILRVDYGSQTTAGVVTYETLLSVDNKDLSLRPGMTATALITTARRSNVLLVPNAALRYTPSAATTKPETPSFASRFFPRMPQQAPRTAGNTHKGGKQRVFVLVNGAPQAVPVTVGESDGRMTEITGGDLAEGTPVIVEYSGAAP